MTLIEWEQEIAELKRFFQCRVLPDIIQLNENTSIKGVKSFVENHLKTVEYNIGKRFFIPYLERLKQVKEILQNENK